MNKLNAVAASTGAAAASALNFFKMFMPIVLVVQMMFTGNVFGDKNAKRLLEDLLKNYNTVVRPVVKPNDCIKLYLGIKLSQIADIDERNQIMTTNVWVRHEWYDYKLKWNPLEYGNITKIKIPSSKIWIADIVLYNNADGDYHITTKTKATIHHNGKIIWEPPMIYKSYCAINIEYYPFDIQDCYMKFGSWTFNGEMIDLEHIKINNSNQFNYTEIKKDGTSNKLYTVDMGIDMSDYYESVEWDVLSVPAQKNIKYYECCPEPYYDIYFNITIRRKTLFYTVNLIIPCVNISFLSVLVFYLPSSSGEKIALGIYVLVALLVFYLLLIELIPPTSIVIPLLGKYLLFTLILVNLSILLTIFILNLHHRKPNTHKMPLWMKRVFVGILPKMLMIERPIVEELASKDYFEIKTGMKKSDLCLVERQQQSPFSGLVRLRRNKQATLNNSVGIRDRRRLPANVENALNGMKYIHGCLVKSNAMRKEMDDWKYAAMVIDRLLLWVFLAAFLIGTFGILMRAPSIYDERTALGKNDVY